MAISWNEIKRNELASLGQIMCLKGSKLGGLIRLSKYPCFQLGLRGFESESFDGQRGFVLELHAPWANFQSEGCWGHLENTIVECWSTRHQHIRLYIEASLLGKECVQSDNYWLSG